MRITKNDRNEGMGKVTMDWISVKDRLPDRKEDVYLCCVDSLAFPGTQYIRILKFYGDGTWRYGRNVTHWMPLPEPPKEEENE